MGSDGPAIPNMDEQTVGSSLRVLFTKQSQRREGDCFAKNARNDGRSAIFGSAGDGRAFLDGSGAWVYNATIANPWDDLRRLLHVQSGRT